MKKYIIDIQSYEYTCKGIAQGDTPDEAIQNFVEECLTIYEHIDNTYTKNCQFVQASGYDLPYYIYKANEYTNLSIADAAKKYITDWSSEVSMTAHEIPENHGKAVIAVEIYNRANPVQTVATNGKIITE